jgi:proteasome assembly chaperone (PAC2) family protein
VNSNNGMLVDDKSAGALLTSLKQFLEKDYNRKDISENARRTFFP